MHTYRRLVSLPRSLRRCTYGAHGAGGALQSGSPPGQVQERNAPVQLGMVGTSAFAHCAGHGSLLALRFYGGLSVACDVSIWQHWSMRKWLGGHDRDARKFTGDYSGCVRLILNEVELLESESYERIKSLKTEN